MEEHEEPHGAAVLNAVEGFYRRFVRLPSDAAVTATVLWIAHTHMVQADGTLATGVTPRLGFISDDPGSGKSTALERAVSLSRKGEIILLPSLAGFLNLIERDQATIGLDEADKMFRTANSYAAIQTGLNSGYKRNGGSITHANRKVDAFAPVAFAGLSTVLRSNSGLRPLFTRTIAVEMRALKGVTVEEYDDELHDPLTHILRTALESWAETAVGELRSATVEPVGGVENRRAQIWRPLLRLAALAGGEWPVRAYKACAELESGRSAEKPVLTPEQRIMDDVMHVAGGVPKVSTVALVESLRGLPETPWRFLWPDAQSPAVGRELAHLLEPHGLSPRTDRYAVPGLGSVPMKGYRLADHVACERCYGSGGAAVTDAGDPVTDA